MVGETIGNYRLLRAIGEGGMGTVYEALHTQIGRRAAIKVLHPELATKPEITARLFKEARAVNIIQHTGIVSILEFGQLPGGAPYLIMEYLEGESLSARLKERQAFLGDSTLGIVRQIAAALRAAHEKGVIHRDLKPDNIMLIADPEYAEGERVKVLDFGIAKLAVEHQGPGGEMARTRTGMLIGTPIYMAPEQCRGVGSIDEKLDVYALGVLLYQLLAGRPPFLAEGGGELLAMHIYAPPPSLFSFNPELSQELVQLCERMLAKLPADRPSMAEVGRALEALRGTPVPRPVILSPEDPAGRAQVSIPPYASQHTGYPSRPVRDPLLRTQPELRPSHVQERPARTARTSRGLWVGVTVLGMMTAGLWQAWRDRKSRPPAVGAKGQGIGYPPHEVSPLPANETVVEKSPDPVREPERRARALPARRPASPPRRVAPLKTKAPLETRAPPEKATSQERPAPLPERHTPPVEKRAPSADKKPASAEGNNDVTNEDIPYLK